MSRTDIHSPKNAVANDYRYLASSFGIRGENPDTGAEVTEIEWEGSDEWEEMGSPTESTASHAVKGKCDHCGAAHRYQTILLHVPSGDIISVGHTCAGFRFNRPEFGKAIAAAARKLELKNVANKREQAAIEAMDEATVSAFNWAKGEDCSNRVARDIAGKTRKYGPLSEKQAGFLVKLYASHLDTEKRLETGEIQPCPNGKARVEGTVVSIKREVDPYKSTGGRWGSTVYMFKILVRTDAGYKVYGTCPVAFLGESNDCCYMEKVEPPLKVGDRVAFNATLEQSKKDKSFGFFSRPSKPELVQKAEAA